VDNRLFFLISKTENSVTVYVKQQLSKAGLKVSPGQLGILFLLKNRNRQTMSELSTELETDNSAITRAVDRLEKAGFVERQMNVNDRREIYILITESGIAETENVKKVIASFNKKVEKEFTTEELDAFKNSLLKLNTMFKGN